MRREDKRLLNVAKACRESRDPHAFTMQRFVWDHCGTPACAVGHYAARRDLQRCFTLAELQLGRLHYYSVRVLNHFGITKHEAMCLFGEFGCDRAKTVTEAAEFIESFVAKRRQKQEAYRQKREAKRRQAFQLAQVSALEERILRKAEAYRKGARAEKAMECV